MTGLESGLEWGLKPLAATHTGVIPAATKADAIRAERRGRRLGGVPGTVVCRLKDIQWPAGREWHGADRAMFLERIAQVTAERDEALEELAVWTGALR
ncbi:hypothetical protein [Streptomyces synnematoformans]|uniref:Transposase n=1 Tax=Streptomyces synnematoformans TaxID=415721 RepID=A0ABN2XCQ0_9ACTN